MKAERVKVERSKRVKAERVQAERVKAERLARGRARARAYFSKSHRKLAQIFSAFFGFWPDSSPEGGNKSRLQAGRNRVLAPESIAFPVFALI